MFSYMKYFVALLPHIVNTEFKNFTDKASTGFDTCTLPPYTSHGTYRVGGVKDNDTTFAPGQTYPSVLLNYTCDHGYYLEADDSLLYCVNGIWFGDLLKCQRYCRLSTHPSVDYRCLVTPNQSAPTNETRDCKLHKPLGTVIRPKCKSNYFSRRPLPFMRCTESGYDSYHVCMPAPVTNNVTEIKTCREDQWKCRDGSCIFSEETCDLIENCADGSDESLDMCDHNFDASKACILPTYPAHGTYQMIQTNYRMPRPGNAYTKAVLNYTCSKGYRLTSDKNQISCYKGAWSGSFLKCVDVDCKEDCRNKESHLSTSGKCLLPAYPTHGAYTMNDNLQARAGQHYLSALLTFTCLDGFGLLNDTNRIFCYNGIWSSEFPNCVRLCRLDKHPSVEYRCRLPEVDGYRECSTQEPVGTIVYPNCKAPHYYYPGVLSTMRCLESGWDNYPVCLPVPSALNVPCRNNQWKCLDGNCISTEEKCDLIKQCPDGSDEAFDMCKYDFDTPQPEDCILPQFPMHGSYVIEHPAWGKPRPGYSYAEVVLNYTCSDGYSLRSDNNQISCSKGSRSGKFLECVDKSCKDRGEDCSDVTYVSLF